MQVAVISEVTLEDYLDAEVVDRQGRFIGTLACFWVGQDGEPAFIGIKTNRDGSTSVVPARLAETDEDQSCVWIRLSEGKIMGSPTLNCDQELDQEFEGLLYKYYRLPRPAKHYHLRVNPQAANRSLHSPSHPSGSDRPDHRQTEKKDPHRGTS